MPKSKKHPKHKLPHHVQNIDTHMKNIMEAAKASQASYAWRHEMLLHHQRVNYQNEHDRIRGILDHTNLPDSSTTRLKARRDNLHKLINENLYPIRHG